MIAARVANITGAATARVLDKTSVMWLCMWLYSIYMLDYAAIYIALQHISCWDNYQAVLKFRIIFANTLPPQVFIVF